MPIALSVALFGAPTFAYETHDLMHNGHVGVAVVNVAGSVVAGLAGVAIGVALIGR